MARATRPQARITGGALWRWAAALALLLGLLGGWLPTAGGTRAATLAVPCDAAALVAAVGNTNNDVLNLAAGCTYTLTTSNNVAEGPNGLPDIARTLTINGNGAIIERSAADGTPAFRLFHIAGAGNLTLSGLTVRGGRAGDGANDPLFFGEDGHPGGGAYNQGTLTVADSTVSNNRSGNGGIGGPNGFDGDGGFGGGLANRGTLTVSRSTISGNTTGGGNYGGCGGGIGSESGSLTVADSTISGNSTSTGGCGGGINNGSRGPATLINSTITDNDSMGRGYPGGGVANFNKPLTLVNTIIAGNRDDGSATVGTADCFQFGNGGVTSSGGHNLVGTGTGCPSNGTGDRTVAPASVGTVLGPLANNGGPTLTHALLPGSPAIDAGDNAACAASPVNATDQRGIPRPQGAACDIGAFEVTTFPLPTLSGMSPSSTPVVASGAADLTLTVTGTDFQPNGFSGVTLNGTPLATTYVSATQLTALVPAALRATAGQYPVTVTTRGAPGEGGGTSNPLLLTGTNPTPTLATLAPTGATAGAGDTTLMLTGSDFAPGATVQFGGTTLAATRDSALQLTTMLPAALLADARTVAVTVTNPGPGGGTSGAQAFTVAAPALNPPQASVAPASLVFGARQVGTASDSQQVVLTNGGGRPLTIADVTIGGANPADFAVTFATCVGQIPASGSCVVGVRFVPSAVGDRAATLQIADDAAGSPQTVALRGTGTTPPASPAPQSVVTATASGQGSVSPAGTTSYTTGGTATYAATPAAGQVFVGWTLDGQYVGYASPLTFTVAANRTLVATFVARPTFADVPTSDPDYRAITTLAALGIINPAGVNGSGRFEPGRLVARAEVAAFIARTFGWEAEFHGNTFPDKCDPAGLQGCVDDRLWNDVAALKDYGIVGGYTDPATCQSGGTTAPCYLPRESVLKLQVISIVARAFTKTPDLRPTGTWDRLAAVSGQYTNVPDAGSQRSDLATYRANAGPIPGQVNDGTFPAPDDAATRRFVIQALWQAYSSVYGADRVP